MDIRYRTSLWPSDPDTIYDIVTDTGFFREDEMIIARELAEETLENPEEYLFIFAEIDGRTVGYACYAEIPGTVGSYDFYWMAVYKELQGQGIGKSLMRELEKDVKARGGRQVYISTSGSPMYAGTRALYDKTGYTKAAVLKDYYTPGDDEVIYVKVLG